MRTTPPRPGWGALYGATPYETREGVRVWMFRRGQRVRFYDSDGQQAGPEQANVAPAIAYALHHGWRNLDLAKRVRRRRGRSGGPTPGTTLLAKHKHPRYPEYLAAKRALIKEHFGDAPAKTKRLILPAHDYSRQPDPPHRHSVIAHFTDERGIEYKVCTNHPKTAWWIWASKGGYRMSNSLRTASATKGAEWRAAVETGQVGISGRE